MKKWTRKDVLAFMESVETSDMNTNKFVITFFKENIHNAWNTSLWLEKIQNSYSFESIQRARRYITKSHWIGIRTKADKEIDFIKEYSLENKF